MQEIDILTTLHDAVQCTFLDYLSLAFEYIFKLELIWILLSFVLIYNKRTRTFGAVLLVAMFLEMCICYPTKIIVDRPRPFEEYEVEALITSFSTGSFPSGHTASCFCAASVISLFDREKGLFAFVLAIAVAFTRLYLFAHYPTDVAAGMLIGVACALVTAFTVLRSNWRTVYVPVDEEPDTE